LALINDFKNTYTSEKRYPSKLFNSSTIIATSTEGILNIRPTTFYKETITIDPYTYGHDIGTYIIYSSTSLNSTYGKKTLLYNQDINDGGPHWSDTSYTAMQIRPTSDIRMYSLIGSGTRTVVADGNGQLSAPVSDVTMKENIRPIGYGINEIMQMNPVWFEFKDEFKDYGTGRQNGNIAQELEIIIPEAVFLTPNKNKKGIEYGQLHAVYIKAIQELSAKNTLLEERLTALENK
jgi:hypothetical protein